MRRRSAGALAACLALAAAGVAVAGSRDKQPIRFNAADQAAARAVVLRKADLGSGGWKGGAKKPDLSPGPSCKGFDPKQSDLVLTGAAESEFSSPGLDVDSEAQVLQTARMVRLDWQRSVVAPGLLPCLRTYLAKSAPDGGTLVSVQKIGFPHVAAYTAAYRVLVDVKSGNQKVRVMVDAVLVGRGRTEVTLTTTAPYAAHTAVFAMEIELARILAGRISV